MELPTKQLSGWGGFPTRLCTLDEPRSLEALRDAVRSPDYRDCIARGLGRSYGDSSLSASGVVLLQTRLNRFLSFDEETGILECEAGVSLAEIIQHLLPRGWSLPTTPGTKNVTVGGAIAADVHGKNHHVDGSFGRYVEDLTLVLASGELITVSANENPELFWATIGGMGLTGVIVRARIRLRRVESAYLDLTVRRTKDLDESLELFAETDERYRHSVAWVDCLALGRSLGRAVVLLANDAARDQLPAAQRRTPLRVRRRRSWSVPFAPPSVILNPWAVRTFNALYYARHRNSHSLIDYERFFYPLDGVRNWNRFYGRRGFIQYQALFPREGSRRGLIELLERIARARKAVFLAVLKSSGPSNPGQLSYLYPGHTIALDLPMTRDLLKLTAELDEVVLRHEGRLYLAKDATTSREAFAVMYPELDSFLEIKNRVDPNQRFVSAQARRLGIV